MVANVDWPAGEDFTRDEHVFAEGVTAVENAIQNAVALLPECSSKLRAREPTDR